MRKLKRRVRELEVKVEQQEKRTNESKAIQIIVWLTALIEFVIAVIALIKG